MSEGQILARFSKCGGDLHSLSRRFHNLSIPSRRQAVQMIADGIDPKRAIGKAKQSSTAKQPELFATAAA